MLFSLKHLATMVCRLILDILQQVSIGFLRRWSRIFGWPFWGCLVGVSHHLKCLPFVIYYSWDYTGHISTGFKWQPFELIYFNFWGIVKHHDHSHQMWHGRPSVPCTGSYTTGRYEIWNWLLFQLT